MALAAPPRWPPVRAPGRWPQAWGLPRWRARRRWAPAAAPGPAAVRIDGGTATGAPGATAGTGATERPRRPARLRRRAPPERPGRPARLRGPAPPERPGRRAPGRHPNDRAPGAAVTDLTVLAANVLVGRADTGALATVLERERPDLVSLPEAGPDFRDKLLPLVAELGYQAWASTAPGTSDGEGVVLLAAARMGDLTVTSGREMRHRYLRATGGALGPRSFFAVHPEAPMGPMRTAWWRSDLAHVARWCAESPGPIVAGDFNATADNAAFLEVLRHCRSAADGTGLGLVGTFPAVVPPWCGIQIDHVLVPTDATTSRFAVLPDRGQRPPRGGGRDQAAVGLRGAAMHDDAVIPAGAPDATAPQASAVARVRALATGWRDPQNRDGMALVLSSAVSSAVGMLYWVVAARMFDPTTVGINTTVVSTLGLLGIVAQLNLGSAMLRFVPVVGRGARVFVAACYATGIGAAVVIGTGFALGAGWWAPELQAAVGAGALVAYFALATPFWTVFNMQDYLLTGIKRATVVPFENLGFALLKIVLLVVGGLLGFSGAIAGSWALGTAVTVVAITIYLLRVLPPHQARAERPPSPVTLARCAVSSPPTGSAACASRS